MLSRLSISFIILYLLLTLKLSAQKIYFSSEMNMIFSKAKVTVNGHSFKSPVRFAPFFNISHQLHFDPARFIGISSGLELKNVGFIIKDTLTSKHRAYSFGVIGMLKIGNLKKRKFLFFGATYEAMFQYKEKLFFDNQKVKRKGFYEDDVRRFSPSLVAGLNWKAFTVRFQYYPLNFFDDHYRFQNQNGFKYAVFEDSKVFLIMVGLKRFIVPSKEDKSRKTYQTFNHSGI